ncbi:MAG TPA: SO_0444 family Cu/Zn efflux transporter [Bdellovibrionota bacterium]|nr:SO_0444 family Cu/Zn efflux transporter [Bdellovibrionota bacterium]
MIAIIINILKESWHIYFESAAYLLFGFILSGLCYAWISPHQIMKHLGASDFLSVLKASLFGLPLPLCSCGVVPTALSLRKRKASKGATLSFLISTPETGVDSVAITFALLGPIFTIIRPVVAFITAIVTGILANLFDRENGVEEVTEEPCGVCGILPGGVECPHTFSERIRSAIKFSFGEFLHELSKWLVLGFLVGGIISAAIPETFFQQFVGSGLPAMLIMLVISLPIYICASSSTPIAAALLLKGVGPGAVLVFLLAGPATNAATFTLIGKFLGKRSLIIYLVTIAIMSLLAGWLFETFLNVQGIDIRQAAYAGAELLPIWAKWAGALIFSPLLLYSLAREVFKKKDTCCK